ncbi:Zinc finger, RING-type [Corchorus capsularis]|uniref:Zinc finger, RING-type n=1 Tax=Corchorus capsularis TaxID=210143 RepID=A0A1R3KHF2_COCAP|nr:Zinc finger, RING-type [Corchorus capsularis]
MSFSRFQEIPQLQSVRLFYWNTSLPIPQPDGGDGQFLFLMKDRTLGSPAEWNSKEFSRPIAHNVPFDFESLSSEKDIEELVYDALWDLEKFKEEENITALGKSISEFLFKNYGLGISNPNSPKPVIVVEFNQTWVIDRSGEGMGEVAIFDRCNYDEAADEEFIELRLRHLLGVPVESEPLRLTQVPSLDSFKQFESAGDPDDGTCAICLEGFSVSGNSRFKLPCSHVFHGDCVTRWLWRKRSCPLCRFQL